MRRRRLPKPRENFSFDSFLDVVANVVGIIIRLILVVWVGARSYTKIADQKLSTAEPALPVMEAKEPTSLSITSCKKSIGSSRTGGGASGRASSGATRT